MNNLLTILIPTKDYLRGLQRIIKNLQKIDQKLKIIISDDSKTNEIGEYIKKLKSINITYSKNIKSLGVANNSNKLIRQCKSKYFMFLHHDDYIDDKFFFKKLFRVIENNKYPDIVSVSTEVFRLNKKNYLHISSSLRFLLHLLPKEYILKRNYLGAPSTLIIKNIKVPLFDSNLSWLVDVDFYYRILRNRKIIFSDNLYIKSETDHRYSLSYRIKKNKNIKSLDKEYIKKKYNFTFLIKVFLFFEIFIWIMIKILNSFSKKNDNN
jgi:glycosyltransferase involved in cell wall biosynthesis